MKTTLELPDDLLRRTKATAAMRGTSMKDFIAEALRAYLRQEDSTSAREEPGWRGVFGKARREEVAEVDAIIAEEFERIDPDAWR